MNSAGPLEGSAWRGAYALGRWLLGTPLANAAIVGRRMSAAQTQALVAARAQRTLDRCGVSLQFDGPPPPPGQGCVVVYNECSLLDVLAFNARLWAHVDLAVAADVYRWIPLSRSAARRGGVELLSRGNRAAADRLLALRVDAARAGARVAWGGEGRLSGQDAVLRFKQGAALIALRAGVPLIPLAFRGGHQAMPLGSLRARPGTIRIRFGEPVDSSGLVEADARQLADRAQAAVAALFAAL